MDPGIWLQGPFSNFLGGPGGSFPYSFLTRHGPLSRPVLHSEQSRLVSLLQVCGVWRAVPRLSLRLLRAEQLHVALVTPSHPSGEVWGPLIRHRALAAGEGSKQLLDMKFGVFSTPRNGVG